MPAAYDVTALGNAIVDVIAPADDAFLASEGLAKGAMGLIDAAQAQALYARMGAGVETSGGSAGNTVAGVASLGGRAAYIGKVADDALGRVFADDLKTIGVAFSTPPLNGGEPTARSLVNVTPDGQRTMSTFLGAAVALTAADVDPALVKGAETVYLEGYLFDPEGGRSAFGKAATLARDAGRRLALSLSDAFVVDRHRAGLAAFLDEVDLVFANEVEALSLFEVASFDDAASAMAAWAAQRPGRMAAVTRGADGSVVFTDGGHEAVAAAPVASVIDTTGAGDQYAAGFLFGLARGKSPADCARLGGLAAAEVIGHYGPRPATPLKALAEARGLI